MPGLTVHSAAEPAEKRLATDGRNQRTVNRAVLRMLCCAKERGTLLCFGPHRQSLRNKIAERFFRRNNRERHDAGVTRQGDIDCVVAVTAGLVDAQLSNDPGGRRWTRHLNRLVDLLVDDAITRSKST